MKTEFGKKIQKIVFGVVCVLVAILLVYLWGTVNLHVEQSRESEGYRVVSDVAYSEYADPTAPTGLVREFCFPLNGEMEHDTTLMFLFNHQNAKVYLDGELVYALQADDRLSIVRTSAANWAMIPLYREDLGSEVRVVLTPVYEAYQTENITFLIGSKYSIFSAQLMRALPEMTLSVLTILAGIVMFFIALYFFAKKVRGSRFFAVSLLAISLGLWNFTQTDFAPFLLSNKTVFLYYVSLTMLMLAVLPLIKSVKRPSHEALCWMLDVWYMICGFICILQLVLQLTGFWDLREMLKVTHGMIIISAAILLVSSLADWFGRWRKRSPRTEPRSYIWLLGAGALADMLMYYIDESSSKLFFVLLAMLGYVLIEGIQLFFSYNEQKLMLEEKETQLTLSRITTMMSQIRSHFVFNILNAISGMCKYDPEKADDTVVRFARYLRNNIDIMEDDKPVLFSTELAHLEDYVMLEQVRFGDKIEFYADVKVGPFMIPPLILQPVVENAIKHGLTQKVSGGTVVLRAREEQENIVITVEDDGAGFEASALEKKESVGLKNIRYRLQHLVHGTLDIESQVGAGTTVTITIPKKEAEPCM